MALVNLVFYVLLISFMVSAVSGIVMFFVDMIRFGTPHKRFETVSSIEKYNEHLAELAETEDSPADERVDFSANIEIDL